MMFRWLPLLLPLLALPPGVLADPGPSMVTATKSRGVVETVHDTVVAPHESTYSYSTQLIGRLQGGAVLFDQTLAMFDRETNPLVDRRPAFGRKVAAVSSLGRA